LQQEFPAIVAGSLSASGPSGPFAVPTQEAVFEELFEQAYL
jgi:hypothetical protein